MQNEKQTTPVARAEKETEALVAQIEAHTAPLVANIGMELVEVQFRREGQGWVLRFFIDREGGVSVDHCAAASREIDAWLEAEELIDHPYTLEVSSPGVERPLKKPGDFTRFAGRRARLRLHRDEGRGKVLEGTLLGLEEERVALFLESREGEKLLVPREQIARARLVLEEAAKGKTAGKTPGPGKKGERK